MESESEWEILKMLELESETAQPKTCPELCIVHRPSVQHAMQYQILDKKNVYIIIYLYIRSCPIHYTSMYLLTKRTQKILKMKWHFIFTYLKNVTTNHLIPIDYKIE